MYVYVHIAKIIFGATHVYIDIFVEHMMSNQNPRVSMRYDLLHVWVRRSTSPKKHQMHSEKQKSNTLRALELLKDDSTPKKVLSSNWWWFLNHQHLCPGMLRQILGLTSALGVATMASPVLRCLLEAKASVEAQWGWKHARWWVSQTYYIHITHGEVIEDTTICCCNWIHI